MNIMMVGEIVSLSSFRVVKKGEILASIGDDTSLSFSTYNLSLYILKNL